MSGKLYLVATPIGNLKDITYRAVEILNEVDVIYCENPLHSLTLLNAYNIKNKLIAYHKFNERAQIDKVLFDLKQGKNIALISDAGTPLISDPGYVMVDEVKKQGYEIFSVPGACAGISALIVSGMNTQNFYFFGFLNGSKTEKINSLNEIRKIKSSLIFYVAPHSLKDDIKLIGSVLGDRKSVLVNEITKMYEKQHDITLLDNLDFEPRGEYVLIVDGDKEESIDFSSLTIEDHIEYYINMGIDNKSAIKLVAKDRNVNKNEIYKHTIKDKK